MSLEDDPRVVAARAILENPIYKEICAEIERRAFDTILEAAFPEDGDTHMERAEWNALKVRVIREIHVDFLTIALLPGRHK